MAIVLKHFRRPARSLRRMEKGNWRETEDTVTDVVSL